MKGVTVLTVCLNLNCLLLCLRVTSGDLSQTEDTLKEVSALQDTNVTLHCDVTTYDDINYVLWKKVITEDHEEVLIHNNDTTQVNKYGVEQPHDLFIMDLQVEDEGRYLCQVNQKTATTLLTVLVPAISVAMTKEGSLEEGGPYNLTCHALHARPPASMTWYRGTDDVTAFATSYTSSKQADGYGDSYSVLHVSREWAETEIVYRCVAGVGDHTADVTSFVFLSLTGGAEGVKAGPMMLYLLTIFIPLVLLPRRWP